MKKWEHYHWRKLILLRLKSRINVGGPMEFTIGKTFPVFT